MDTRKLVSVSELEYLLGMVKSARVELVKDKPVRCDAFLHSAQMWLEETIQEPPKKAE